jgi:hypothetical protein
LRIIGHRKSGLMRSSTERVKLPLAAIASAKAASDAPQVLRLTLQPGQPFEEAGKGMPVRIRFEDAESVKELLEMMNL